MTQPTFFDGRTFVLPRDGERLKVQLNAFLTVMRDGQWHQLWELNDVTGYPEASISARLRDLRKPRFGGWIVERRYVSKGLWEYRLGGKQ